VRPGQRVLARDARRQLRLVVSGLMGSGKSTLSRMLAQLLGGVWVNQDEFSHRGRAAKRCFLAELSSVAQDPNVPVLIIDKINTLRQHRAEIFEALQGGVSGDCALIEMRHPTDHPGCFNNLVRLCLSRVRARGHGHRTLMGSDPKLPSILRMTAAGAEPLEEEELARFSARFVVDVTAAPGNLLIHLLADLDAEGLLGRFQIDELISHGSIAQALHANTVAEEQLLGSNRPATAGRTGRKAVPIWLWTLEFGVEAKAAIRDLWSSRGYCLAPVLHNVEDFHVTLLYCGGGSDKEIASRHSHLGGAWDVMDLRQKLQKLEGQEVELLIAGLAWDRRVAAGQVMKAPGSQLEDLCANLYPHVTLAVREGVPPRVSNEMLARLAANEDLDAGLGPWLEQLSLGQYKEAAGQWCYESGAASADELVENAGDLAEAMEPFDEDQRGRLRTVFTRAAPGDIVEDKLETPLQLRCHVRGRRRGE